MNPQTAHSSPEKWAEVKIHTIMTADASTHSFLQCIYNSLSWSTKLNGSFISAAGVNSNTQSLHNHKHKHPHSGSRGGVTQWVYYSCQPPKHMTFHSHTISGKQLFCYHMVRHHMRRVCVVRWILACADAVHSQTSKCSCGSVVEHCVSSAKVVGSIPREHMYWQKKSITWMHCKSLWIKASAKCINVNLHSYLSSVQNQTQRGAAHLLQTSRPLRDQTRTECCCYTHSD